MSEWQRTDCEVWDEHQGQRIVVEDEWGTQFECTACGAEWFESEENGA